MDKPSSSKRIAITDPDFRDQIRGLLTSKGVRCESEDEFSVGTVDDSDADSDYVILDEEPDSSDSDIQEPRGERFRNCENDNNNQSYDKNERSGEDGRPNEDGRSDEDKLMLEEEYGERNIPNIVAENIPIPEYFPERLKKKEYGPPNAWASNPPIYKYSYS